MGFSAWYSSEDEAYNVKENWIYICFKFTFRLILLDRITFNLECDNIRVHNYLLFEIFFLRLMRSPMTLRLSSLQAQIRPANMAPAIPQVNKSWPIIQKENTNLKEMNQWLFAYMAKASISYYTEKQQQHTINVIETGGILMGIIYLHNPWRHHPLLLITE